MYTLMFFLFFVTSVNTTILFSISEFHMLQLNRYKIFEHLCWIRKNLKRYIVTTIILVLQILLILIKNAVAVCLCGAITLNCILILIMISKIKKNYKRPIVITARVKRMIVTFGIIYTIFISIAVLYKFYDLRNQFFYLKMLLVIKKFIPESNVLSFIVIISTTWLTPILVILSNIINKPIETLLQKWYINDCKSKLSSYPNLHKVGITGSYGKTSMKFYLSELLSYNYEILKTPESFNTPMGITTTIRRDLNPIQQYFVCEMGARRIREISELCHIVMPHDCIITSIGSQHLETFKSIKNVVNTKFELADYVKNIGGGKIYLNGDNDFIRNKLFQYPDAITYGMNEENDWRATDISISDKGTEFTLIAPNGKTCRYFTKLLGKHNVTNLLGAISYVCENGISMEKLIIPIKRITAVPHRLQLLDDRGSGITFIDDTYNSNPSGCRAALNVLGLFDACRILVTPGMVELGKKQYELNFKFGQEAVKVCDYIVLVGKKQTVPIYNGIKCEGYNMKQVYIVDNLSDALAKIITYQTGKKKIVLLENDLPDNY